MFQTTICFLILLYLTIIVRNPVIKLFIGGFTLFFAIILLGQI